MKKKLITRFAVWAVSGMVYSTALFTNVSAQESPKLSDPEIASVAVVANQIDIGYAEIAKKKSKDADVLKFAETMANDHKAIIGQAVALVTKLGVTPKDNAVSKKLLADAATTKKMLNSKSGRAFNKAYIDNEVAYHKAVISTVEGLLIPQARNQELKDLLQKVVPTLKTHLAHAEMVQSNYKGNGRHMGKM
jgi:putative membrane protein